MKKKCRVMAGRWRGCWGEMGGELIRRDRQTVIELKKMGRAEVRCLDGEVTREADERWREKSMENKEICHISC